jgi:Chondroitinase B
MTMPHWPLLPLKHARALAVCALLLGLLGVTPAQAVLVRTPEALRAALATATPGTVVTLRPGVYPGDYTLTRSGRPGAPIVLRPKRPGSVVFRDSVVTLAGDYAEVRGLVFDDGQVTVTGNYNRVTRTLFRNGAVGYNDSRLSGAVEVSGSYNRIDHNEVAVWHRRGLRVLPHQATVHNRFDHNYLHDFSRQGSRPSNSGDALQVGSGLGDVPHCTQTLLEYNLLERVEADAEALSVKASCTTVRFNTFRDSQAVVQVRSGARSALEGNTLENVRALTLYGDDHRVVGNVLHNAALIIRNGNHAHTDPLPPPGVKAGHATARYALVACNTVMGQLSTPDRPAFLGVGTGLPGGEDQGGLPVVNITLAENSALVEYGDHVGTRVASYDCTSVQAVRLTPADVGLSAPETP